FWALGPITGISTSHAGSVVSGERTALACARRSATQAPIGGAKAKIGATMQAAESAVRIAAVKPAGTSWRNLHSYRGHVATTKIPPNKKAVKKGRKTRNVPVKTRATSITPMSRSMRIAVSRRLAVGSVAGVVLTDVMRPVAFVADPEPQRRAISGH